MLRLWSSITLEPSNTTAWIGKTSTWSSRKTAAANGFWLHWSVTAGPFSGQLKSGTGKLAGSAFYCVRKWLFLGAAQAGFLETFHCLRAYAFSAPSCGRLHRAPFWQYGGCKGAGRYSAPNKHGHSDRWDIPVLQAPSPLSHNPA